MTQHRASLVAGVEGTALYVNGQGAFLSELVMYDVCALHIRQLAGEQN